jgi:nucleoside-triphosphatase THEP1
MSKELLEKKISEYVKLEKIFKTDKKLNLIYNEKLDQDLAIKNLENNDPYIGFYEFIHWIEGKTKEQLKNDLVNFNKPNDKKIKPSKEQKAIVECMKNKQNCKVDAVAGSGKTTTILFIAKELAKISSEIRILQLTYNKELKLEVRERVDLEGITNIDIHTYHSMAVRFYDKYCYREEKIMDILTKNIRPKIIKKYDIIIADEVQDITPNYFSLLCKFVNDMKLDNSTFLILGDRYQCVYSYKGADKRFLTFSEKIFNNKDNFIKLSLQESYRVTKKIAWFVNTVMLGNNRIISNKESNHPIYYYRWNFFSIHIMFLNLILKFLKDGYKPSDIFILAPSLKSTSDKNPIKKLENKLVENNIPVYFSRNDEEGLDKEIITGKVVFTTFHKSKGRERKICFVFGFDNSYFTFYNKKTNPNECPPELYVATTRASEILVLFECDGEKPFSFLQLDHEQIMNHSMIKWMGKLPNKNTKIKNDTPDNSDDIHKISVTELTSYINEENNQKILGLIDELFTIETKPNDDTTADIPSNIKTENGKIEDVSDINGIAIPAIFEHEINGVSKLQIIINEMCSNTDKSTKKLVDAVLESKVDKNDSKSKFLCMGNLYIALNEKIHSKLSQIDKYKWLTSKMLKICLKNLKKNIGKKPEFELSLGDYINEDGELCYKYVTNTYGNIYIVARCDCIDKKTLWEFKCVSSLSNEHLLQLIVYAWIWEKNMKEKHGKKNFKILNIRTGETKILNYNNYHVEEIMSILFDNKYFVKPKENDENFLKKCKLITERIKNSKNLEIEKSLFKFDENNLDDYCDDDNDDNNSNNENIKEIKIGRDFFSK